MKELTSKGFWLFPQKSFIVDFSQGPNYTSTCKMLVKNELNFLVNLQDEEGLQLYQN